MELNILIVTILERLLNSEGSVSVLELERKLGVTRRVLDYNVRKLNNVLEQGGFPQVTATEKTLQLDISRGGEMREYISAQPLGEYVLSAHERELLIALSAGLLERQTTTDGLCRLMSVSRNTVLGDMAELRRDLENTGLVLDSSGRQGYRLRGDELVLRCYLYEQMLQIPTRFTRAIFEQTLLEAVRLKGLRFEDRDGLYAWLEGVIQETERQLDGRYNHNSIQEIRDYILLIVCRAGKGNLYLDRKEIGATPEYQMAQQVAAMLSQRGIDLPEEEHDYLATVLLGAKRYSYSELAGRGQIDLYQLANDFIDTFEAKACVHLNDRDELVRQFIVHLRPLYYRLKYQVKVRNLLCGEIKREYSGIYDLTRKAADELESRLGMAIPEEELAHISVYLLTWLKRRRLSEKTGDRKILIVCGAGVGTSLLLRQQISEILGMGYRYETRDARELARLKLEDYDLIVSTMELPMADQRYLKTDPVLTDRQKELLLEWGGAHPERDETQQRVDRVLEAVERHGTVRDRIALTLELRRLLTAENGVPGGVGLWEALTPDMVRICGRKLDQRQAIRYACARLESKGLVDGSYADSVSAIIEQMGLYAEVSPGVLLAHAKPGAGVHGVGLSLTVFSEQIEFARWSKRITAVFTLCTPDNQSHLRLLRELMQLLDSESVRTALMQCPYDSAGRLYRFLRQTWENRT